MSVTVKKLRQYIQANMNILLEGPHGTGKTQMILEACEAEGLTVKMFNAATVDVYTDFTGVPVPETDAEGRKYLQFVRPRDVEDADVIFLDELNRANDVKTTNASFELVQFGSINGEKLPRLRAVFAAQNPLSAEMYDVAPLDPALVDRFDLVIPVDPKADLNYFATKFPRPVAKALVNWYNDHSRERTDYLSPRRLEMIGRVFMTLRDKGDLERAMPPQGTFDTEKLWVLLTEATLTDEERSEREKSRADRLAAIAALRTPKSDPDLSPGGARLLAEISTTLQEKDKAEAAAIIPRRSAGVVASALTGANRERREVIVEGLRHNISARQLVQNWAPVLSRLQYSEVMTLMDPWSEPKRSQFKQELAKLTPQQVEEFDLAVIKEIVEMNS